MNLSFIKDIKFKRQTTNGITKKKKKGGRADLRTISFKMIKLKKGDSWIDWFKKKKEKEIKFWNNDNKYKHHALHLSCEQWIMFIISVSEVGGHDVKVIVSEYKILYSKILYFSTHIRYWRIRILGLKAL